MTYDSSLRIGTHEIALDAPSYFIADIAANHDGDLERAKDLIWKSKEAGADCAKFQHFIADRIVSKVGFEGPKGQVSHQAKWKKSVVGVYDQYHTRRDWTDELVETCQQGGHSFHDHALRHRGRGHVLRHRSCLQDRFGRHNFPRGNRTYRTDGQARSACDACAASMAEVEAAADLVLRHNRQLCLMQCNTNYTGSPENFKYVNLHVLQTFAAHWPGMVLGFSDHTPGHSAVLGAVALGARVIEKHFTDDNSREGPDHSFALNPVTWRAMVDATRELEAALGDGVKRIEKNEMETVIIQRRALRLKTALDTGTVLSQDHLEALRPCPEGAVSPDALSKVLGKRLASAKEAGKELLWTDLA